MQAIANACATIEHSEIVRVRFPQSEPKSEHEGAAGFGEREEEPECRLVGHVPRSPLLQIVEICRPCTLRWLPLQRLSQRLISCSILNRILEQGGQRTEVTGVGLPQRGIKGRSLLNNKVLAEIEKVAPLN
jgi:hypothetical protein